MPPREIEVVLTWSKPDGEGGHWLGSGGEEIRTINRTDLWALLAEGLRDGDLEVTTVTIWTPVQPRSQGNTTRVADA